MIVVRSFHVLSSRSLLVTLVVDLPSLSIVEIYGDNCCGECPSAEFRGCSSVLVLDHLPVSLISMARDCDCCELCVDRSSEADEAPSSQLVSELS